MKHFSTHPAPSIRLGGKLMSFELPKIMGILNLTADSFYDGGQNTTLDAALKHVEQMVHDGADIIDIGGQSTRPGAALSLEEEELNRVVPVISAIQKAFPNTILSVDTYRARVAEEAIRAGAHIINDVSGGQLDQQMFATVAKLQVPYILMHMRGTPDTMQQHTIYDDVVADVAVELGHRIATLRTLGVRDILLDPGFGFAKTSAQNYELLLRVTELHYHGLPILGGISRKSMIYRKLDISPAEALPGTIALNTLLLERGVQLLRVHDVKEAKQLVNLLYS
ncbi:dihydropteroate synthase [Sphingobacterium sp. lm-10]|uniref:dihydropteroate synthase n=1 Tax=Sphingobacterium sp. lm-10 TaxID=2944904 RepID=UPI0020205AF3|nr:dihydropteroate synthase [Sphingobacterium sp. lm-10]MCL7988764.1 dihydropteroate synthase [Sphingobacterium sp. lm-10]